MSDLATRLGWPGERLGEATLALAGQAGFDPREAVVPPPPPETLEGSPAQISAWILSAARYLRLEAEPVESSYAGVEAMIRGVGPALVRVETAKAPRFLAILGSSREGVTLLGPDHRAERVPVASLASILVDPLEAKVAGDVDGWLDAAGLTGRRRERARRALLRERLAAASVQGAWMLRQAPGGSFGRELGRAGFARRLATFAGAHLGQIALTLVAWSFLGRAAFGDHVERGWLIAAALLLLSIVPLQLLESFTAGRMALEIGALLKQRLLVGALRLDPEEVRSDGAGRHLGRIIEAEALEGLILSGAAAGVVALIEIVAAAVVAAAGAGGALASALIVGWTALAAVLAHRNWRRRRAWTDARLHLTNELVERMVGHQTRLAQEPPESWHASEDQELEGYLDRARSMDGAFRVFAALQNRGFLLVGIAGLLPAFVREQASPASLAVGLGAVLLAQRALQQLAASFVSIIDAAIGWRVVRPLFDAASREPPPGAPLFAAGARALGAPGAAGGPEEPLLEGHDLFFRYGDRVEHVIRGVSFTIHPGDRILLEGRSGGGKSTLAALLTGLRAPSAGLLLLRGLDGRTLGQELWHRHVTSAPQFHENHVLTGPLAYNLLLGRAWPPTPELLAEAEALCRSLDLGDLLDRMPGGLHQMVGETGWQLSHGERGRLFLARALLQGADLVVLDESFAALDPETMRRCLECVMERAKTVVVIAHP